MSPWELAAVWIASGCVGAALAAATKRRAAGLAPLIVAAAAAVTQADSFWPGPMGDGHGLVLGRVGLGLALASALSASTCLLMSSRIDGRELAPLAIAGALSVVIMAATSPLVWAAAIGLSVGALVVRWLSVAPGGATLAAGRIAGLGAAALVAASPFATAGGSASVPRSAVAAVLLAVGVCAVLGVPPVGGWVAGCLATVRDNDMGAWVIVLVPAVLISTGSAAEALPAATRYPFRTLLLIAGCAGAVWGAVNVLATPAPRRYGRMFLADVALSAAAIGTGQPAGRQAGLVLMLLHLVVAPLLLHPARPGMVLPRRLAWLALSGAPLTPAFWGRLLVLQACSASGAIPFAPALIASGLLLVASVAPILGSELESDLPARPAFRLGAWAVAVAGLAVGVAPFAAARLVFGGI